MNEYYKFNLINKTKKKDSTTQLTIINLLYIKQNRLNTINSNVNHIFFHFIWNEEIEKNKKKKHTKFQEPCVHHFISFLLLLIILSEVNNHLHYITIIIDNKIIKKNKQTEWLIIEFFIFRWKKKKKCLSKYILNDDNVLI